MINKLNLKYYLIPAGILFIIFLIALIMPSKNKKTVENTISPTSISHPPENIPTRFLLPTSGPSPTLIPLRFTGADLSKDIPPTVALASKQKSTLRRLAPLTLSFAVVEFDYTNDIFLVQIPEPKDTNGAQFTAWRQQNYPALAEDQFIIN